MTIRCAIVDDEKLAREGLRILLQRCHAFDLDVVGEAGSIDDALALLEHDRPDLVFLDINMPGRDGFDLVRAMEPDRRPLIVFVTAYPEHAVHGFEASAVDYLLKPVSDRRLTESLRRVRTRIAERDAAERTHAMSRLLAGGHGDATLDDVRVLLEGDPAARSARVLINDSGRRIAVDLDAIVCIQAAGDYMCISTTVGDIVSRTTLSVLASVLGVDRCMRVHRSAAVNPRRVREIVSLGRSRYRLLLDNGASLESSRRYSGAVRRIAALIQG